MIPLLLLALALAAEPVVQPPRESPPPSPPAETAPAPAPQPCPAEEPTVPVPPGYEYRFPDPPKPSSNEAAWRWTAGDYARELAVLGLIAEDWRQTRAFRSAGVEELNPLLGRRPSRARVNSMIAMAMLIHVGVSVALPHDWRVQWQTGVGGAELVSVVNNVRQGWR